MALPFIPDRLAINDFTCRADWEFAARLLITLDGVEVKACVAFDRVAGFVDRYSIGPDGEYVIASPGRLMVDRSPGVVVVSFKDSENV